MSLEPDVLHAIRAAANIYNLEHKAAAFMISVALREIAKSRPGSYGIDKVKLSCLADEFAEFS